MRIPPRTAEVHSQILQFLVKVVNCLTLFCRIVSGRFYLTREIDNCGGDQSLLIGGERRFVAPFFILGRDFGDRLFRGCHLISGDAFRFLLPEFELDVLFQFGVYRLKRNGDILVGTFLGEQLRKVLAVPLVDDHDRFGPFAAPGGCAGRCVLQFVELPFLVVDFDRGFGGHVPDLLVGFENLVAEQSYRTDGD